MKWESIIGLEIHAELKTKTKMFCSCLNDPEEKVPNKNICPVCLAHPGTLPVINKKAVNYVVKVGLALNSFIPEYSKFDRKNYFYPDLPKGYQISQYDEPLCQGGELSLYLSNDPEERKRKIKITRIHLEEDVGKLIHSEGEDSLIDYNRAGVPLMELVTEPVMHSGREARLFAQGLQILFRVLNISEANMEKGQMRCEVNISLKQKGDNKLGTKVEIKNLNSFRSVEQAIEFEIKRQTEVLEKNGEITQETRGWNAEKGITYSQRVKETSQDYRYLPEPDLPPLHLYSREAGKGLLNLEQLKKEIPLLPWEKKEDLLKTYDISNAEANLFVQDEQLLSFFENVIKVIDKSYRKDVSLDSSVPSKIKREELIKLSANYIFSDMLGIMQKEKLNWDNIKIKPNQFADLIIATAAKQISSRIAKDLLLEVIKTGQDPRQLISSRKLEKLSDLDQLLPVIKEIIAQQEKAVADYKKGKENSIKFLVGQAMAQTRGTADPVVLEKLFKENIK